jgi:hypothetical protein
MSFVCVIVGYEVHVDEICSSRSLCYVNDGDVLFSEREER